MGQTRLRMRASSEKQIQNKKHEIWLKRFFRNFFLWIIGSAIGVIPVYLKQIEIASAMAFPESYDLWQMTLNDFDFSFICVSALFILFLEGCLLNDEFPAWQGFFPTSIFICLMATAIVYLVSYSHQDYFFFIWKVTQYDYNIWTLGGCFILGFVCHIAISLRKEEVEW